MFLPNKHSFLLLRAASKKPIVQFGVQEVETSLQLSLPSDSGKPTISDKNKRTFLKMAGIAVLGLGGSLLLPKKADALIMGSSPTTGVVGVKNSTNARISPATEGTVSSLLKPGDLALNAGVLQVKVTSVSGEGSSSFSNSANTPTSGRVDDTTRNVWVDVKAIPSTASTETTLQTISFGGQQFTLRLATDTVDPNIDYIGEANMGTAITTALWRIKRIDSTTGIIIQWAGNTAGDAGTLGYKWSDRATLSYF